MWLLVGFWLDLGWVLCGSWMGLGVLTAIAIVIVIVIAMVIVMVMGVSCVALRRCVWNIAKTSRDKLRPEVPLFVWVMC